MIAPTRRMFVLAAAFAAASIGLALLTVLAQAG
jgi:hypothetical protein